MIEHRDLSYWKGLIKRYDEKVSKLLILCKDRIELSENLLEEIAKALEGGVWEWQEINIM